MAQTTQLPQGFFLKDGYVYRITKDNTPYNEGVPAVLFVRDFSLGDESNFYDIDLDQETLNRKLYHKEIDEGEYKDYGRLNNLVFSIKHQSESDYHQHYIHGKIILRTFVIETNDKKFHIEKVRFMLDYIKSFRCRVAIYTNNMGRLFDDLGTTKYLIRRWIEEGKLEIHFISLGFCLDKTTLNESGFLKEDTRI